jgi:hypothetical protein
LLLAGCQGVVIPPARVEQPTPIYIADYGRHSSLLLPSGSGMYREYAFGDWDWYASNSTRLKDACRALFFSRNSTLGVRDLRAKPDAELRRDVRCLTLTRLVVDHERVKALRCSLDWRFDSSIDTIVYNEQAELHLVKDDEHYGIANTCNHVTAKWLEELGCVMRGSTIRSDFRVESVEQPHPPQPSPAAAGASSGPSPGSPRQ